MISKQRFSLTLLYRYSELLQVRQRSENQKETQKNSLLYNFKAVVLLSSHQKWQFVLFERLWKNFVEQRLTRLHHPEHNDLFLKSRQVKYNLEKR